MERCPGLRRIRGGRDRGNNAKVHIGRGINKEAPTIGKTEELTRSEDRTGKPSRDKRKFGRRRQQGTRTAESREEAPHSTRPKSDRGWKEGEPKAS